jgi:prephenate dehydrogenase
MKAVTIFGVGLMGGSFALALKAAKPTVRIIGVDRPDVLNRAHKIGVLEDGDPEESDLFVLATPVGEILQLIETLDTGGKLITDLGSTKVVICQRAEQRNLPFVGGHPMAGSERTGLEAARADLFKGTRYFLCPVSTTPPGGLEMMRDLVQTLGATPEVLSPEEHDRLVAQISHLPQLLSTLLADHTSQNRQFAGPGLKSMTRLAGSPFHVWQDILKTSGFLPHELRDFIDRLTAALESIDKGDLKTVKSAFDRTDDCGGKN